MSTHTVDLTSATFEATVQKAGIVFVDFWASWCGPCRAFAPVYERVAANNPDITFAKLSTEEAPDIAGALEVSAIPTLMIFREGILLFSQAGMLPQAALEELVSKVKALDMDEVRRMAKAKHADDARVS